VSRAEITLNNAGDRDLARRWIGQAKWGTRIEFKAPVRNLKQNARFWAMLNDVSRQHRVEGRRFLPDEWKVMFLTAYAEEMALEIKHLPAIHRAGLIPAGRSSSDLSEQEMNEVIAWMLAWGAESGIVWSEPKRRQEEAAA
jgi:hypothetical protein